jgi:hypothetical protein
MYCANCHSDFPKGTIHCDKCGTELSESRPVLVVWRGGNTIELTVVEAALKNAGIEFEILPSHDSKANYPRSFSIAPEIPMFGPLYEVRVSEPNVELATEIADKALDTWAQKEDSSQISISNSDKDFIHPSQPTAPNSPAQATSEVWSGDDDSIESFLEAAFKESDIVFRVEGDGNPRYRVFVVASDFARASEIVREINEATPPA